VDATFNIFNDSGLYVQQKESVRPKKDRQTKASYVSGDIDGFIHDSAFYLGICGIVIGGHGLFSTLTYQVNPGKSYSKGYRICYCERSVDEFVTTFAPNGSPSHEMNCHSQLGHNPFRAGRKLAHSGHFKGNPNIAAWASGGQGSVTGEDVHGGFGLTVIVLVGEAQGATVAYGALPK